MTVTICKHHWPKRNYACTHCNNFWVEVDYELRRGISVVWPEETPEPTEEDYKAATAYDENEVPPPESVCQEADRLVSTDRQADYGHPITDFTRTGRMWGAILGLNRDVTPNEVALMMAALKISREVNKHKRDNLVDACGYIKTCDLVVQAQCERDREVWP